MKRIAISQSNYLPWKGYFDLIASVDEFVLYDCVQYTRRDWRNRNKIKCIEGSRWITVPVKSKGRYHQTIAETQVNDDTWRDDHLSTLRHAYGRAAKFGIVYPWLENLLTSAPQVALSALNRYTITAICDRLGIATNIRDSSEFSLVGDKTERLLELCLQLGASEYVSGPAAKSYLNVDVFSKKQITVRWKAYDGYPEYDQPFPPFDHRVSIVDVLMCTGPEAPKFIRSAPTFEP